VIIEAALRTRRTRRTNARPRACAAAAIVAFTRSVPDLDRQRDFEARLVEHPDDEAGYLVYGDWLQGHGDPRGSLIAIQAARRAGDTPELAAAEAALIATHGEALLGAARALDPPPQIEWHLGFWRALTLGPSDGGVGAALARLVDAPSARLVRELRLRGPGGHDRFALAARLGETLRELEVASEADPITDRDVDALRACLRLHKLTLSPCARVTPGGLAALAPLRQLTHLELGGCVVSDAGAAQLAGLPLSTVRFNAIADLGPAGMRALAGLPLTSLALYALDDAEQRHELSDAGVAALAGHPTLASLELAGARIAARGAAALGTLTSLRRLRIPSSAISDRHAGDLPRGLRSLCLAHCTGIGDDACAGIARMPDLELLDLASTRVTGAGLRAVLSLRQLAHLDLSFLELGDRALTALAGLAGLRGLSIGFAGEVTDRVIDTLETLRGLEVLDIAGSAITPAGIERLARMPQLRDLGVSDCDPEAIACARGFPHWYVDDRETLELSDAVAG
jgi:uncharacterized protein (TIGR02996 family)